MRGGIGQVMVDERADFVLPGRVLELFHLVEQALPQIPSATPQWIEGRNGGKCIEDLLLARMRYHNDVGKRSPEVAVLVDVFNEKVRKLLI